MDLRGLADSDRDGQRVVRAGEPFDPEERR